MRYHGVVVVIFASLTLVQPAVGQPIPPVGDGDGTFLDPGFTGVTEREGWDGLSRSDLPGYPDPLNNPRTQSSSDPWPQPVASQTAESAGNATFDKLSGAGYPASGSIYNSGPPGTFVIENTNPIAGLETVLFQIDISDAFGFTFVEEPVLSFNGGSEALVPLYLGSFEGTWATIQAFQWDLRGSLPDGPLDSYEITWTGASLTSNGGMQLDSSDTFQLVPEPSVAALIGIAMPLLLSGRRRRGLATSSA